MIFTISDPLARPPPPQEMAPPSCPWWGTRGSSPPPARSVSKACGRYFSTCPGSPPALAPAGTTPGPAPASVRASLPPRPPSYSSPHAAGRGLSPVSDTTFRTEPRPPRAPAPVSAPVVHLFPSHRLPQPSHTLWRPAWPCLRAFAPPGPTARGLVSPRSHLL